MTLSRKIFTLLPLLLLTACGKGDDQQVNTAAVTAPPPANTQPIGSCQNGQVWSAQYGCGSFQYGYPGGGFNGNYYPVEIGFPQGGCPSGYWNYPGPYGYYRCSSQSYYRSYRWYYYNGIYYYF